MGSGMKTRRRRPRIEVVMNWRRVYTAAFAATAAIHYCYCTLLLFCRSEHCLYLRGNVVRRFRRRSVAGDDAKCVCVSARQLDTPPPIVVYREMRVGHLPSGASLSRYLFYSPCATRYSTNAEMNNMILYVIESNPVVHKLR